MQQQKMMDWMRAGSCIPITTTITTTNITTAKKQRAYAVRFSITPEPIISTHVPLPLLSTLTLSTPKRQNNKMFGPGEMSCNTGSPTPDT
jgi:hypothetical protein